MSGKGQKSTIMCRYQKKRHVENILHTYIQCTFYTFWTPKCVQFTVILPSVEMRCWDWAVASPGYSSSCPTPRLLTVSVILLSRHFTTGCSLSQTFSQPLCLWPLTLFWPWKTGEGRKTLNNCNFESRSCWYSHKHEVLLTTLVQKT